jgi:hypothetical protein
MSRQSTIAREMGTAKKKLTIPGGLYTHTYTAGNINYYPF